MQRKSVLVVGLLVAAAVPLLADSFWLNLFILALIYIPLALGLTVLFGYTNLVSLGQGGFFAIGAYTSALLALELGLNVWMAIAVSVVAAGAVGYVIARPILRFKGLSLAMATLAFGQMVFILVQQLDLTGGPVGLSGIPAPELFSIDFTQSRNFYWLALVIAVTVYVLTRNLARSRFGRSFRGLGVSEPAARTLGVNTESAKALAFVYAAGLAGLAGALYAHYFSFISSDTFGLDLSILVLIIVVVGGLRSLPGAVIGTVIIFILREYLKSYQEYSELVYGLLLILVFMAAPDGIMGLVHKLRNRLRSRNADPDGQRAQTPSGTVQP